MTAVTAEELHTVSFDFSSSTNIFIILFHISNLMAFLAFLLRDHLHLRMLMAVSLFLQGLYYYAIPGGPLFDPLLWKIVSFLANLAMIVLVFGGKLDFGIPKDLRGLFNKISVLSPGQFRKLIKTTSRTTAGKAPLLRDGEKPAQLHYLLKGGAVIIKGGTRSPIQPDVFLGEIAFLNNSAASATVHLLDAAECISWDSDHLRKLMRNDNSIDIAMRGIFNHDLAAKVARSVPLISG
jgi:Popeye protein conserved region